MPTKKAIGRPKAKAKKKATVKKSSARKKTGKVSGISGIQKYWRFIRNHRSVKAKKRILDEKERAWQKAKIEYDRAVNAAKKDYESL